MTDHRLCNRSRTAAENNNVPPFCVRDFALRNGAAVPAVAGNCKSPDYGNRKSHILIVGVSAQVHDVGKDQQQRSGAQMQRWERSTLLSHYLELGVTKTELSRRFGVSRRTIQQLVETGQLDRGLEGGGTRYSARPSVDHKLDPYQGIIETRLEEFPRLSENRLYDEVRAAGYTGGYVRVTDYARSVRPREPVQTVVRFETPADRHYAEHRVLVSQR